MAPRTTIPFITSTARSQVSASATIRASAAAGVGGVSPKVGLHAAERQRRRRGRARLAPAVGTVI